MSTQQRMQVREDLELIERFSRSYREQFAGLIAELNKPGATAQTGGKCLRMCVEAVDMLLEMQRRLAEAVGGMENLKPLERNCSRAA